MGFLEDSAIWVLFSFLIFLAVAWKLGKDKVLALLDRKIANIRKDIETAESLRIEAQELLAQYQRKQRDAAKESEQIIATAQKHVEQIKKQAAVDLKATMKRREQQLEQRIKRMEENAIEEIKAHAATLAVQATAEIIADKLDQKAIADLTEQSIESVVQHI